MNYVSKKEATAFALFMAGEAIFNTLVGSYVQVFFTDVGIAASTVGILFLFARIWDAINDPIFGGIVDRCNLKGGKFLPWLKMANFLVPFFAISIFMLPQSMPYTVKVIWASVTYICYGMSYTICDVPIFSLSSAITNQVQERVQIMSRNTMFSTLAILVVSIVLPLMYPQFGWKITAVILSLTGAIFMFRLHNNVKERFINKDEEKVTFRSMMDFLGKNKYLMLFFAGLFLLNSTNTVQTAGLYFSVHCLGKAQFMSLISLSIAIPTIIFSILMPKLTQRFDKFQIFLACVIGQIAVAVITFVVGYNNLIVLLILFFFRGCVYGSGTILMFLFAADFVEYGEYKTGKRLQGTTYSIQTFVCKLYTAVAEAVSMFTLSYMGFVSGDNIVQSESAKFGCWSLVSIVPAIGAGLSLIFFLQYKLKDKDVQIMAKVNSGELEREEAEKMLSREY